MTNPKSPTEIAQEIAKAIDTILMAAEAGMVTVNRGVSLERLEASIAQAITAERTRFDEAVNNSIQRYTVPSLNGFESWISNVHYQNKDRSWKDVYDYFASHILPIEWPSEREQSTARELSFDTRVKPTSVGRSLAHDIGFEAGVAWLKSRLEEK